MKSKTVSIICLLLVIGSANAAQACSASQVAVGSYAKKLATIYISLANQYYALTGNGAYINYAKTYWDNYNANQNTLNRSRTKAQCYLSTVNMQNYVNAMKINDAVLQKYVNDLK